MVESQQFSILIVDDIESNVDMLVSILGNEYEVMVAMDGPSALELAKRSQPDLILLDIMMPEMDGYIVCQHLKASEATHHIPVIFVTALNEVVNEAKGFEVGGVDYITKPVSAPVVRARVKTHLAMANQQLQCEMTVNRQMGELMQNQKDSVYMLGHAGHYNDDDTGLHIWRMASYSKVLSKKLGWSVQEQNKILLAAPMHDTGKIGMPDAILKKPSSLSKQEWVIMRRHTTIGHKILAVSGTELFRMAADIALYHHERWDGGGYPEGLSGTDIPEAARIVAVTDVFDALTMQRPYKKPWAIERAIDYITNSQGHFEPRIVKAFLSIQDEIMAIRKHWNRREKNKTL